MHSNASKTVIRANTRGIMFLNKMTPLLYFLRHSVDFCFLLGNDAQFIRKNKSVCVCVCVYVCVCVCVCEMQSNQSRQRKVRNERKISNLSKQKYTHNTFE